MADVFGGMRPGLGTGIYTVSEAARLLQVPSRTLKRWAEGYVYVRNGDQRRSGPLLDRENAEPGLLTFYDLVELFFVKEFRKDNQVELPHIRAAAARLRERWQTPYPFALKRIVELNRQLVEEATSETVLGQQRIFEFGRQFFRNVDFDEDGLAMAWHPLGKDKLIVVDPQRSFGAPIDTRSGIRTDVLYRQYRAEGDAESVADWYEIPVEAVEQAIEFEERWTPAA